MYYIVIYLYYIISEYHIYMNSTKRVSGTMLNI